MLERTLCIIKPDATTRHLEDEINEKIREAGFEIIASKRIEQPTREQFEAFYAEHKGKDFYERLLQFMTSGPIVVQVLEGEDVIQRYRTLMGKRNPAEAAEGTLRRLFAESETRNSVHGSDSPQSAAREIALWFTEDELK